MSAAILLPEEKEGLNREYVYIPTREVNAFSSIEEDAIEGSIQSGKVYSLGYLENLEKTWVEL